MSDAYYSPADSPFTDFRHELADLSMLTHVPRHRRASFADVQNNASCTNGSGNRFCTFSCPRHNPHTYAEYMARHATDSL